MSDFRHMHGVVYLFENPEAQRVKVGMTINNFEDRLRDVNHKWVGVKATCQICGGRRFFNDKGLIPQHVVSGKKCPGGNALPLEKDVKLAENYREEMINRLCDLSGDELNSTIRRINNLEKRIEMYRHYNKTGGVWYSRVIFYTDCAEQVELNSHKILEKYLDKLAPFGEVFCCSVSVAAEAVETAMRQLEITDFYRIESIL